eukprot:365736-Chlamydomonas_euryale.AAC.4
MQNRLAECRRQPARVYATTRSSHAARGVEPSRVTRAQLLFRAFAGASIEYARPGSTPACRCSIPDKTLWLMPRHSPLSIAAAVGVVVPPETSSQASRRLESSAIAALLTAESRARKAPGQLLIRPQTSRSSKRTSGCGRGCRRDHLALRLSAPLARTRARVAPATPVENA